MSEANGNSLDSLVGLSGFRCGDCRDVLPVECDAVVTDPPYKGYDDYAWEYHDLAAMLPCLTGVHGFWCWSGGPFPLAWTARHVWSKANRNIGKNAEQYEEVYELHGGTTGLVFRHAVIDSDMNATLNGDIFLNHPCQKPIRLIQRLVDKTKGTVCDPFMGSGTTGIACIRTGRRFIGIEKDAKYFEIARARLENELRQGLLPLTHNASVRGGTPHPASTGSAGGEG